MCIRDRLCDVLEIPSENCKSQVQEILPMCSQACTKSGLNPRGLMGDACVNLRPSDSKHSCASVTALQMLSNKEKLTSCQETIKDETTGYDKKMECTNMFLLAKELVPKKASSVSSEEIDIVKQVALDSMF